MKLYSDGLEKHLSQGLKPVYLVSGDEPLQLNEACDAIRVRAREQGFTEREVLNVDKSFDWNQLLMASHSMSLFGDQRLIELRLPTGKPGDKGGKALREYADNLPPDTLLLIVSGKIEAQSQKSKWFTTLDSVGVSLQVWPVEQNQLSGWVTNRMRSKGLQASQDAVTMLVERVEGNLLAAAQEIEKLCLLHTDGNVSLDDVEDSVTDSSRFDVYGLVDTALKGDKARIGHMLDRLHGEGAEPVLLLWALTREIRMLELMTRQIAKGMRVDQVLGAARVWAKRKPLVTAAVNRHPATRWQTMLQRAGRIDRMVKGQETGNVWDELLQLCLMIAGVQLMRPPIRLM